MSFVLWFENSVLCAILHVYTEIRIAKLQTHPEFCNWLWGLVRHSVSNRLETVNVKR